jgi:hypothetical protein
MADKEKKRGFAALSPERLRQIASSGGVARKKIYEEMRQLKQDKRPTSLPPPPPPQA